MAKLVVTNGANAGNEFEIEADGLLLGRLSDGRLRDVFRNAPGVSRSHARVRCRGHSYILEDLGSRNGTIHNGRMLKEEIRLGNGDEISIGGVRLQFVDGSQAPPLAQFDTGDHHAASICSSISVTGRPRVEDATRDTPRKFHALVSMLAKIGESLETDVILEQLLAGLFDIFENVDHGFVALRNGDGTVTPRVVRNHRQGEAVRLSRSIVDRVMSREEAVLSVNASSDERFQHTSSVISQNIRSLMCSPLMTRTGECIGVIQLETMDARPFKANDLEVLVSVTPHAATALDYARVHAEELQRRALNHDLRLARQIQRDFLPSKEPQVEGYQFFAYYEAAYQVGGDYYDYIELPDGRLCVVVADVAGKGVSAALIMSKFAGEFKYILARDNTLGDTITQMNDILLEDHTTARFITVAALVLDPQTHQIELVNAGHTDTLLVSTEGQVAVADGDVKGTPIGMFPGQSYQSTTLNLERGAAIAIFTDGLTEATREDKSLYGCERIMQQVGHRRASPDEIGLQLLDDVRKFVGDYPQSDDMCLVCLQRVG